MHKFRTIAAALAIGIASLSIASTADAATSKKASQPRCHAIVKGKKSWSVKFCPKPAKQGANGINGKNGANGFDGHPGKDGLQGINGKDGVAGQQGAQGQQGVNGKDGTNGLNGVSGYEVRTWDYIKGIGHRPGFPGEDAGYVGANNGAPATVVCSNPNKVAIAGGYWIRGGANENITAGPTTGNGVAASFPGRMDWSTNTPRPGVFSGWIVRFNGAGSAELDVTLYVICINAA
jgi:hypothetical protein